MERNALGDLIKLRREKADLTQDALAERSGISRNTISAIEQGRIKLVQPAILKDLVRVLPLSMGEAVVAMGYDDPREDALAAFFADELALAEDLESVLARVRQRLSSPPRQTAPC